MSSEQRSGEARGIDRNGCGDRDSSGTVHRKWGYIPPNVHFNRDDDDDDDDVDDGDGDGDQSMDRVYPNVHLKVSCNGGTPKWMVYNGKSIYQWFG